MRLRQGPSGRIIGQEVKQVAAVGRAARGSRYVDQRHYVLPDNLADLRGPDSGHVELARSLDWSGDSTYDLDAFAS